MYKRFSLSDLGQIQNNLIPHFYDLLKKERLQSANEFFKIAFKEGNHLYYFNRGDIAFRVSYDPEWDLLFLHDEIDKIEIVLPFAERAKIQNLLKNYIVKKERQIGQKTIEEILMEEFKAGAYTQILGKNYLVYDIETTVIDDLRSAEFLIGYSMEPQASKMEYTAIMKEDLKAFVDKMLNFDGYIVGFNQIWFDNPVVCYNLWYSEQEIKILNQKSIDLYVFINTLTKKRIGLNRLTEALVGISKTLESGAQGEVLRNRYQETWEQKYLDELKKYCKNDVRMTALLMIYLLHFKKVFVEGEEYAYSLEEFVQLSNNQLEEKDPSEFENQAIF